MNEAIKAYTAGFIDGEGWMGIFNANGKNIQAKTGRKYPGIAVHVIQKNRTVLDWLSKEWGFGSVIINKNNGAWRWIIYAKNALCLLNEIMPYLIVKKSEAEIIVQFPFGKMGKKNDEILKKRVDIIEKLKIIKSYHFEG